MAEREPMRHNEKLLRDREKVVRAHLHTHDAHEPVTAAEPVTGVGAMSGIPHASGAGLGGDTGDVGTPRMEFTEDPPGGAHGSSATPETSTVMDRRKKSA